MTEQLGRSEDYASDFNHTLLVVVLIKIGGHIDLATEDLQPDAMGNRLGELHQLQFEPRPDGSVRLSVVARES
jgi:hypothetical protein